MEKDSRASRRGDPAQQGRSLNLGTKPGAGLGSVIGWRSARKLATGLATATMRCHAIGRGAEVTTGKEPHLGDRVTSFGNLVPGELMRLSYLPILCSGHRRKRRGGGGPTKSRCSSFPIATIYRLDHAMMQRQSFFFFFFFFFLSFAFFYRAVYEGEGIISCRLYSMKNERWKFMDMLFR